MRGADCLDYIGSTSVFSRTSLRQFGHDPSTFSYPPDFKLTHYLASANSNCSRAKLPYFLPSHRCRLWRFGVRCFNRNLNDTVGIKGLPISTFWTGRFKSNIFIDTSFVRLCNSLEAYSTFAAPARNTTNHRLQRTPHHSYFAPRSL
jgi:hypothetical protein